MPTLLLVALAASMGWAAQRLARRTSALGATAAAAAVTLSVALGLVSFTYPPQALMLLQQDADPIALLLGLDLWGPRFVLSYPAVLLRNLLGWPLDVAYTRYASALLVLMCLSVARVVLRAAHPRAALGPLARAAVVSVVAVQVTIVAAAMNGRLVPAFLGMALILDTQLGALVDHRLRIARLALGVFLTMMSSGTMMVGLAQVLVVSALVALRTSSNPRRAVAAIAGVSLVVLAVFAPLIAEGIAKNLAFYDGSVIRMLSHGAGQLFFLPDAVVLLLVLVIVSAGGLLFARGAMWIVRAVPTLEPLLIALPLSIALGLFGYSTLLMFVPPLIALTTLAAVALASPFAEAFPRSASWSATR